MTPAVVRGALPRAESALSVLTFNVLLPNSEDGWWTYKMYSPGSIGSASETAWAYRAARLRECVASADADVVCLQECAPESFSRDFEWMAALGYDARVMFEKKGRFRPATFWKSSRVQLAGAPVHRDRALLTCFDVDGKRVVVVNCHLQAGPEGGRRLSGCGSSAVSSRWGMPTSPARHVRSVPTQASK